MIKRYRLILGFPLLIFMLFLSSMAASAEEGRFTVRYGKIVDGQFIEQHKKWRTAAAYKEKIRTVEQKDKNGRRCYWKVRGNDGHTDLIRSGQSFTVRGNCRLTPVWRKIYTIRLWNKNGTKEYVRKRITFCQGDRWQLPALKVSSLYLFSGWSRTKGNAKADLLCGKWYRTTSNLNLYAAVHKRIWVTVRFYTQAGGSEYTQLNSAVLEGGSLTLPRLSSNTTYSFLGWSTLAKQKSAMYKAGDVITADQNLKLYAVFVLNDGPIVQLKTFEGETWKILIPDGKTARFPSVALGRKQTLMGWSTQKGKTAGPEYLEGQLIPVKAAVYYMAAAAAPLHNTPAASKQTVRESGKYVRVYFVGDSRMTYPDEQFGSALKKTRFIAEPSSGYDWLAGKNTGYAALIRAIRADNQKVSGKKAVIFCHGINDLAEVSRYITFYKAKAKELTSLGCQLYVMSVNPFCAAQREWYKVRHGSPNYKELRTQEQRETFNKKLKKELAGIYTYLNLSAYLERTGWPTCSYDAETVADGLHYSLDTNKRIISAASRLIDLAYK